MSPTLYILMRTDMASMNPGKAMAQAAHAAHALEDQMATAYPVGASHDAYKQWKKSTSQGFGVTYTLGANEDQMRQAVLDAHAAGHVASVVHDPTYPIHDGRAVHAVPVDTCAYVFTRCRVEDPVIALHKLDLHP